MKRKLFTVTLALVIAVASFAAMLSGCKPEPVDPALEYVAIETKAMHQTINDIFEHAEPASDLHATATVEVTLSDLLFEVMDRQDLNWIDNVYMNFDIHQNDDLASVLAAVNMNGKPFFSYDGVMDTLRGVTYVSIPTISDHFIEVTDSTANGIASLKQVLAQLNTPETAIAKALLIKYVDIALNNMVNIEKTTETLTVNGTTQEVNAYTNYITQKVIFDGIKAMLTEAKNDNQLKAIFPAEANIEGALDEALTSLNSQTPEDDKANAIVLVTYADKEGNVLGRKFSIPTSTFTFSHIALPTASGSVSETFLGDSQNNYRLAGTRSAGSSTYTLSITSSGQSIEVGTINLSGNEKKGSLEITLSDFVEQNLFGSADADVALKAQWDISATAGTINMSLDLMSEQLVAVRYSIAMSETKDVTVPSDSLDVNDTADVQVYSDSINTYDLMNNMLAIGFPSEYVDAIINKLNGTPAE